MTTRMTTARQGRDNSRYSSLARASALVLAPVLAFATACGSSDASADSDLPASPDTTYSSPAGDSPDIQTSPDTAVSPSPDDTPDPEPTPSDDVHVPPHADDAQAYDLGVSHEAFAAIAMGMTPEQVSAIIGSEPDITHQDHVGDVTMENFTWMRDAFGFSGVITVSFTDLGAVRVQNELAEPSSLPTETVTNAGITAQARQAIYVGMSREVVEAVIGFPGELISTDDTPRGPLEGVLWIEGDLSEFAWLDADFLQGSVEPTISVGFLDGLVVYISATV